MAMAVRQFWYKLAEAEAPLLTTLAVTTGESTLMLLPWRINPGAAGPYPLWVELDAALELVKAEAEVEDEDEGGRG